jgi:hypothetical protein
MAEEKRIITDASRSTLIESANYNVSGAAKSCDVYSLGEGWYEPGRIIGEGKTQWGGLLMGKSLNGNGVNALFRLKLDPSSILSFERTQFNNKRLKNGSFRLYGNKGLFSGNNFAVSTLSLDITINRGTIDVKFPTDPWGSKNSRIINNYYTPGGIGFNTGDKVRILGSYIGGSEEDNIDLTVSNTGFSIVQSAVYAERGKVEIEQPQPSGFQGTNYQIGEKILIPGSSVVMIKDDRPGVDGVDDVILIITEIERALETKVDNVLLKYDREDKVIYFPTKVALEVTKETAENNIKEDTAIYSGTSGAIYSKTDIKERRKEVGYGYTRIEGNNKDITLYFRGKLNNAVDDFQSKFLYTYFYFNNDGSAELEYTTTVIRGDRDDSIKLSFVDTLPYDTDINLDLEVLDVNENWIRFGKPDSEFEGKDTIYAGYILDPTNPGGNVFFENNIIESGQLVDESYNNLILTQDSIEEKLGISPGDIITRIGIPLPILGNGNDITNAMIENSQFVMTAVINTLDYSTNGGDISYNNFSPQTLNTAMIVDGAFDTTILDTFTARTGTIELNPNGTEYRTRYLFYDLTIPFNYNGNDLLITYWIDTPIPTFNTTRLRSVTNKEVINMSANTNYMGTDISPGTAIALSYRTI